ncbi:MAG: tagatose 1,6-diphosphate aldolase [Rubrivivax sp.]
MGLARWGKHWGLRRLADAEGLFSMVAVDQRPPIVNLVARARGIASEAVGFEDIVTVKALLAQALAPHASALLVDPDFGLPAATAHLRPDRGLVLTLEEHRYDDTPGGRRSRLIPHWSVAQIRSLGADAVKLLAWYRPDAAPEVRAWQQDLVFRAGQDCAAHDIPFVFELLVYPYAAAGGASQGADCSEDAAKQSRLVIDSVRAFADARYGVDLFKLESPVHMARLPDPHGSAGAEVAQVQALFDEMGAACAGTPWVLLSAGGSMRQFEHALVYACRAGASGFLAGRAVWWEALQAYPDRQAVQSALQGRSVPYLQRLRETVERWGHPCRTEVDFGAITQEGQVCLQRPSPQPPAR